MSKKVVIGICACTLIVGATLFLMIELSEARNYRIDETTESQETTDATKNFVLVAWMGSPHPQPSIIIDVPVTCGPKEKYVAALKKCVRSY